MSISKITKIMYKCQDGREFDNEFDARDHELFLRTRGLIETISAIGSVPGKSNTLSASQMARNLLDHAEEFSKEWGNIKQALTRLNKVSEIE